jgi:hypothetical protein
MSATAHAKLKLAVSFHEAQSFAVPINFSPRVTLLGIDSVRALRGCDAEAVLKTICNAVHPRCLRFVFNLAVNAGRRTELRFWKKDVLGQVDKNARPETVIDEILGTRQSFPRGEIEIAWTLSAMTICKLIRAGELIETSHQITRESLASFLQRRLQ